MRSFKHIADFIRSKRVGHPKRYSQSDLSRKLGYKNGQFISNVERGLCSIPLKMIGEVARILDVEENDIKSVILRDFEETIDNYLEFSVTSNAYDELNPN